MPESYSAFHFILTLAGIAVSGGFGAWMYRMVVAYWKHTETLKSSSDSSIAAQILANAEKLKVEEMQSLNFGKLNRENLEIVGKMSIDLAATSQKRADTAEVRSETLIGEMAALRNNFAVKLFDVESKLDMMVDERNNLITICVQLEQQTRMLCDVLSVAYWTITPEGHLEANMTFFETLVGLSAMECHNDGWLQVLEAKDQKMWRHFLGNFLTKPVMTFTFKNAQTGVVRQSKVFCNTIVIGGSKIYKFTAQTAPLTLG